MNINKSSTAQVEINKNSQPIISNNNIHAKYQENTLLQAINKTRKIHNPTKIIVIIVIIVSWFSSLATKCPESSPKAIYKQ